MKFEGFSDESCRLLPFSVVFPKRDRASLRVPIPPRVPCTHHRTGGPSRCKRRWSYFGLKWIGTVYANYSISSFVRQQILNPDSRGGKHTTQHTNPTDPSPTLAAHRLSAPFCSVCSGLHLTKHKRNIHARQTAAHTGIFWRNGAARHVRNTTGHASHSAHR